MSTESDDPWEEHAAWWQEEFTGGVDAEYEEQILPLAEEFLPAAGLVLDVGTGEGQVARCAAAAGLSAVGIDPAWAQISEAGRRGGGPVYLRGTGEALPFADCSFDAAVACLVLEHLEDLDPVVVEMARVLAAGGTLLVFINHPLFQTPRSGWIDDRIVDPPEQYWRVGPYLTEQPSLEHVSKGVQITFVHRPLGRYLNALAGVGLVLRHMEEPPPPPGFLARAAEYREAATIPRLMLLVLEKEA
ncbi:MAG: Ubiquinone/menaquinone biosynthesis C-methyltransferase UbiE [Acidimicrobiales bacterium]|nr:MAG: class I SAM-dependent methyltransferase [Actinomycetota bacterium]MBV6509501.1 Ubiquinone/menaquinone biosynthesis C-methyltransferase UbiE [Acidimicrobiales bacterium]RIK06628.1 MAG: class I SAM-dependent methyltransferase [Acidobacteriota bacterium]